MDQRIEGRRADGPGTVAIFGRSGHVTDALGERIRRRGGSTHVISVATGWPSCAAQAVLCLDTPAGWAAARGLDDAAGRIARAHVVGLHVGPAAPAVSDWALRTADRHDVTLVRVDPSRVEDVAGDVARVVIT